MKWIGTIASVIGSFTLALQFALIGYCLFLIGSVSWLIVGIKNRDKALITLNLFFFAANIIGFYKVL
jgi:nicotinamide riboside transporter PnuC